MEALAERGNHPNNAMKKKVSCPHCGTERLLVHLSRHENQCRKAHADRSKLEFIFSKTMNPMRRRVLRALIFLTVHPEHFKNGRFLPLTKIKNTCNRKENRNLEPDSGRMTIDHVEWCLKDMGFEVVEKTGKHPLHMVWEDYCIPHPRNYEEGKLDPRVVVKSSKKEKVQKIVKTTKKVEGTVKTTKIKDIGKDPVIVWEGKVREPSKGWSGRFAQLIRFPFLDFHLIPKHFRIVLLKKGEGVLEISNGKKDILGNLHWHEAYNIPKAITEAMTELYIKAEGK